MNTSTVTTSCKPHGERLRGSEPCGYPHARRGLSTVEFLVAIALVTSVLTVLVLISNSLRQRSAHQRTVSTLRALRHALSAYHARNHAYPVGSTHQVIGALLSDPEASRLIGADQPTVDAEGRYIIRDGFGHPVYYRPDATSGGDFISVGADGRMGDIRSQQPDEIAAVSDNVYGSDLQEDAAP